MDDLISKQVAIDALRNEARTVEGNYCMEDRIIKEDDAIEAIQMLPPAQPEPSTEIQEILNYLDTTLHPIVSPNNWNVYAELHDMVSRLLSAQPDNKVNLCDSCKCSYPDCPSGNDVIFGNGTGNDNICACSRYEPSAQPEITDEQAIEHLQSTGWMQNHDHEMYMMGIRERLGDDSDSYDSLMPKVGRWTYHSNPSFGINPEDAYCSRCGFHVYVVDVEFDDYKYCPNCGVKMEEQKR